ncbi:MAG: hypothetical protein JWL71_3951 [Acidobacteria bacterium]|nr:hypothetical protein [Acidobacteriota bacterium]
MGALTENHRCPRGSLRRLTDAFSTVGMGAVIGMVVLYLFDDQPVPALVMAAAALGAVLTSAVRQAVSGRG